MRTPAVLILYFEAARRASTRGCRAFKKRHKILPTDTPTLPADTSGEAGEEDTGKDESNTHATEHYEEGCGVWETGGRGQVFRKTWSKEEPSARCPGVHTENTQSP